MYDIHEIANISGIPLKVTELSLDLKLEVTCTCCGQALETVSTGYAVATDISIDDFQFWDQHRKGFALADFMKAEISELRAKTAE